MQTHKLTINDGLMKLIPLLFDGRPETIVAELLQNARRAQATRVTITLNQLSATKISVGVEDNGIGISAENIDQLLSLTGSGWDNPDVIAEVPAGMGFLCLSGSDVVTVSSVFEETRTTLNLAPENFAGKPFVSSSSPAPGLPSGTLVAFTRTARSRRTGAAALEHSWAESIESVARYCGLQVEVRGSNSEVSRVVEMRDFCDDTFEPHMCRRVDLTEEYGVELLLRAVGVTDSAPDPALMMNFYGLRLGYSAETLRLPPFGSVHINVKRADCVRLVLPARNAVQELTEEFVDRLRLELFRMYATVPHRMDYKTFLEGRALVPHLPEALPLLRRPSECGWGEPVTKPMPLPEKPCLLPPELTMSYVASHLPSVTGQTPVCEAERFRGYSWYNALPTIYEVELAEWPPDDVFVAEKVTITLRGTEETGEEYEREYDVPYYYGSEDGGTESYFAGSNLSVVVSSATAEHASEAFCEQLADGVTRDCFYPYEDRDSDSDETQIERFREELSNALRRALISPDVVLAEQLLDILGRHWRCGSTHLRLGSFSLSLRPGEGLTTTSDHESYSVTCITVGEGGKTFYSMSNQSVDVGGYVINFSDKGEAPNPVGDYDKFKEILTSRGTKFFEGPPRYHHHIKSDSVAELYIRVNNLT